MPQHTVHAPQPFPANKTIMPRKTTTDDTQEPILVERLALLPKTDRKTETEVERIMAYIRAKLKAPWHLLVAAFLLVSKRIRTLNQAHFQDDARLKAFWDCSIHKREI